MLNCKARNMLLLLLFHLGSQVAMAQNNVVDALTLLSGAGNGGDLCLVTLGGRSPLVVRSPVASGDSVPHALEQLFANASSCYYTSSEHSKAGAPRPDIPWRLFDTLSAREYVLAGSETGFSIPPAPLSLTCAYDKESKQLRAQWENPQGDYDQLFIVLGVMHSGEILEGGSAEATTSPLNQGEDQTVAIVGYRGGVPSNCAVIALRGSKQVEFFSYPFLRGVAPNWAVWGSTSLQYVQLVKEAYRSSYLEGCLPREEERTARFAQQLKANTPEACGGMMRKFIGLNPGHSYRVVMRTSTLEMPLANDAPAWRYSLHAAYTNAAQGNTLSQEQLTGQAPLPDGTEGENAGRFALFNNSEGTNGDWVECGTNIEHPGKEIGDIVLPDDASTIVIWARYQSSVPDDPGVAFDYLELEDLGPLEK